MAPLGGESGEGGRGKIGDFLSEKLIEALGTKSSWMKRSRAADHPLSPLLAFLVRAMNQPVDRLFGQMIHVQFSLSPRRIGIC